MLLSPGPLPYYMELNRKLIHLSSLWMPLIIYYTERGAAVLIFTVLLAGMLIYETVRIQDHGLSKLAIKLTHLMLREHETKGHFQLTGASYVLISALIVTLLFPKIIAITALSIMLISDTAAALIGKRYGQPSALGKSWAGSIAFAISGFITIFILSNLLHQPVIFIGSGCAATLAAMMIERYSKQLHVDDNLSITLTVAIALSITFNLVG